MESPAFGLALCAIGLEKVCQSEIEHIGLKPEGRESGRVRFSLGGPPAACRSLARANLCLRTAERILVEAGRFRAADFDQLFESVRALPWELYFRLEDRLVIERVRIHDSRLAAQTSVQSIVHKAIYERLCSVYRIARMPETGTERSLRVYLESDECLIGVDCSGEALHKRGYRRSAGQAPLKETVAAGAILLSGWSRRLPLLDPFCGSGTIAIEAALFAMDVAPGLGRPFALDNMPFSSSAEISAEIEAAKSRIQKDAEFRIVGSDADGRVLEAARANARRAGLGSGLEFRQAAAEEAAPGYEIGSFLCNPPYGERMGSVEEAEALYRRLGEVADRFSGWGLGFVTNRFDFGDFFGRYASSAHKIINGAEEQWFHWYRPGSEGEKGRRPSEAAREDRESRGSPGMRERDGAASVGHRNQSRTWVGPDKPGWKAERGQNRRRRSREDHA